MVKTTAAVERCGWCTGDPLYEAYHDDEWGVPVYDGPALFERLVLEGMQAGLSWLTVLKKRAHMTEALMALDPNRLAAASEIDFERWLEDAGLIRNRAKLRSAVRNARAYLELEAGGSFSELVWSFTDGAPLQNRWRSLDDVPAHTPLSVAMSKTLKRAGFNFVGPTICYAFMQSVGMVNDHVTRCFRHAELTS